MSATKEQPPPAQAFTGKLMKGTEEGSVRGWLFDHKTGFRIEFNGAKDPRPQGRYLLAGKRVPV